jgi:clan AA aspartic protease
MTGKVNADLEAQLQMIVHDALGNSNRVVAVIDTGFNGFLTLRPETIAALGLPWLCRQQGELADGSVLVLDVYVATVKWQGHPRTVEVEAANCEPLLGMAMLLGSELRLAVVPGGTATVELMT